MPFFRLALLALMLAPGAEIRPLLAQTVPDSTAAPRARTLRAAPRTAPVTIDGRLNEPAWREAEVATGFVQKNPVEGQPAEHATEVRVLYDDDAIFVGARMYDPEPGTIARQLVRRDNVGNADWFAVGFDPRLDRRTGYAFIVSAANVQRDEYLFNDSESDGAWDAVWTSAVQIDSLGWTAEIRIPLSQLRYQTSTGEQTWGINFVRARSRSNEETHFALMSALQRGQVSQFGTLTSVRVGHAPRRMELRPYVVAGGRFEPVEPGNPFQDGARFTRRAGVDVRYGLGSSFTLDATFNPDFGQVEADPAVINLTAFETFLPERRPFFVEDARIFDFSLSGMNNRLFYGRRIGRKPTGTAPDGASFAQIPEAATILGAAKITGRTARGLSMGMVAALTDRATGNAHFDDAGESRSFLAEPGALHGAARARQDFNGGASTVGVIATHQARQLPGDRSFDFLTAHASSAGVDWEHQWGNRTYGFTGYVAGSLVRGDSTAMIRIQRSSTHFLQRPDATRLRVDSTATSLTGVDWRMTLDKRRGEHWTGAIWAAEVTPTFEVNDLGFSGRQEVLDAGARVQYREIVPGRWLRSYRLSAFTFNNWSHEALDNAWSASSWGDAHVAGTIGLNAEATLLNYWQFGTRLFARPELTDRNGTRGGPLMLSPRQLEWSVDVRSDDRRRIAISPSLEIARQAMGAGRSEEFGVEVAIRPSSRVEVTVEPTFERSRIGAQFVGRTSVLPYSPTFGTRYLFGELERRELGLETRLNVTFSPRLTLQMFAQPLLSSGDFVTYKQLVRPRSFVFDEFEEGAYLGGPGGTACASGRTCQSPDGTRFVDFDGDGTADHSFPDRDFNIRSFIGNSVLRWEYRPGSALYLVWQHQVEDEARLGDFHLSRDAGALFRAPARNVLLLKTNYWVGF